MSEDWWKVLGCSKDAGWSEVMSHFITRVAEAESRPIDGLVEALNAARRERATQ